MSFYIILDKQTSKQKFIGSHLRRLVPNEVVHKTLTPDVPYGKHGSHIYGIRSGRIYEGVPVGPYVRTGGTDTLPLYEHEDHVYKHHEKPEDEPNETC